MKQFGFALRRLLILAIGPSIIGCGTSVPMGQTDGGTTSDTSDTTDTVTSTAKVTYESAG